MTLPPGLSVTDERLVCRLKKSLYGLKQAARQWYLKLSTSLLELGFVQSKIESSLFVPNDNQSTYILTYVDDILVASSRPDGIERVVKHLEKHFEIQNLGPIKFFLGIKINQDRENSLISLNQKSYIEQVLKRFRMEDCSTTPTPMDGSILKNIFTELKGQEKEEKYPYKELYGCLNYISGHSRPDISFTLNLLGRFMESPTEIHWKALKRILRYLKGTIDFNLKFGMFSDRKFCLYTDSDFAGDSLSGKSTSGAVITFYGSCLAWISRKQKTVAQSTHEAEYVSLSEGFMTVLFIRNFLEELGENDLVIQSFCDNQSAIKITKDLTSMKRAKHINKRYHFCRDLITSNEATLEYIPTEQNISDIFTKPLNTIKHVQITKMLNLGLLE